MKRHTITKEQLNDKGEYIGDVDVSNFDGDLFIEDELWTVFFKSIRVTGSIIIGKGTNIKTINIIRAEGNIFAGRNIWSDGYISSGGSIKAEGCLFGCNINAKGNIYSSGNIEAKVDLCSHGSIRSDGNIYVGRDIRLGGDLISRIVIKVGGYILAKGNIKAGHTIRADLSITGAVISCDMRILAGVCWWKIPSKLEMMITAQEIIGDVAYGIINIIPSGKIDISPKN